MPCDPFLHTVNQAQNIRESQQLQKGLEQFAFKWIHLKVDKLGVRKEYKLDFLRFRLFHYNYDQG